MVRYNTHIGDFHATDMLQEGYLNLGGLARERYGADLGTERLPSLSVLRGRRVIGVVYQNYEGVHYRNYVPTNLARRYDSFIFIDQTTALKDLSHRKIQKGRLPETWPSGM